MPNAGRGRAGQDTREVIADLNPILRGWGSYFRTGNAAQKFVQIDSYVERRLGGLMQKATAVTSGLDSGRPGRVGGLSPGSVPLRGNIPYPGIAS